MKIKKTLQEGYDEWMKTPNEVKKFWMKWHLKIAVKDRMDMSISETSALVTETATVVSNLPNSTNELFKGYLSSNTTASKPRTMFC